jgi:hypothetical protein
LFLKANLPERGVSALAQQFEQRDAVPFRRESDLAKGEVGSIARSIAPERWIAALEH